MSYSVCVVTGTRAEFGLLSPLIAKLRDDEEIDLRLVVTGSHLSRRFGYTVEEIEQAGCPIAARIKIPLEGDSKTDMAKATGHAMSAFADYFSHNRPELLVVLGDRYEIFAAAASAALLGIPIAHLYGGETTEGAVDEFLRHSITKMSSLHFTACEAYRRRVIQLGEAPERVFNVGALGVENVLHLPEMPLEMLSADLDLPLSERSYAIVTLHSVTQEENTAGTQVKELIEAMESFPQMQYIITKANTDAGGRLINQIWEKAALKHQNWRVIASLGAKRYLTALKHARMMIGNSSSGIIEAPAAHIATINIGDRQKGRMMADSVICCAPDTKSISNAIQNALTYKFNNDDVCPFGNGNTSARIVQILKNNLSNRTIDIKKVFYDI